MNLKKIVISGLAAGLIAFLAGSILYMNPLVADIYTQHGDWAGAKPMDTFGGIGNWMLLMLAGGLVSTVFLALLYSYTEKGIKAVTWKKGAVFGILIWLVNTLPAQYNAWLMYSIPEVLLTIETFNGLIGSVIAGIVLAVLYEKID